MEGETQSWAIPVDQCVRSKRGGKAGGVEPGGVGKARGASLVGKASKEAKA